MAILEIASVLLESIFYIFAFDGLGIKLGILNKDKSIDIRGSVKFLIILLLLLIPLLLYRMNIYTGEWFYFLGKLLYVVFAFGAFVFVLCSIVGLLVSGYNFLKQRRQNG